MPENNFSNETGNSLFSNEAAPEPTAPTMRPEEVRKARLDDAFAVGRGHTGPLDAGDILNRSRRR
jgi:hypothetical protein